MTTKQTRTTATLTASATKYLPAVLVPALPALPALTATTGSVPMPVAPPSVVLVAARTSSQQAGAWLTANGNTMPPSNLPLAVGPSAPKGRQGGQRWQHGTAQQAAVVALGKGATVASVTAWCRANGAMVPGCNGHGAQAGAVGNLRFAFTAGVLAVG